MKASELIEELKKTIEEYGDIEAYYDNLEDFRPVEYIHVQNKDGFDDNSENIAIIEG